MTVLSALRREKVEEVMVFDWNQMFLKGTVFEWPWVNIESDF